MIEVQGGLVVGFIFQELTLIRWSPPLVEKYEVVSLRALACDPGVLVLTLTIQLPKLHHIRTTVDMEEMSAGGW